MTHLSVVDGDGQFERDPSFLIGFDSRNPVAVPNRVLDEGFVSMIARGEHLPIPEDVIREGLKIVAEINLAADTIIDDARTHRISPSRMTPVIEAARTAIVGFYQQRRLAEGDPIVFIAGEAVRVSEVEEVQGE